VDTFLFTIPYVAQSELIHIVGQKVLTAFRGAATRR
jgi:hypothetical protein